MRRPENLTLGLIPDQLILEPALKPQKVSFEEKARIVTERILPMQIHPDQLDLFQKTAQALTGFAIEEKAHEGEPFVEYHMIRTGVTRDGRPIERRQLVDAQVAKDKIGVYLVVPSYSRYSRPYVSFTNKLKKMGYEYAFSFMESVYPTK